MKLRNYIFGLFASLAVLASCEPEEELLGPASLKASGETANVELAGGSATFQLKATRDWTATITPEESGFTVSPLSGKGSNDPQTITVSAEKNTGKDRIAILTFTSENLEPVTVRLYQAGEKGGNYTLAELRAWGTEKEFPFGAKTEVVVISNKEVSTVTNVTAFVQDETAGLQFRFASAHSFAYGEKISVNLEGLKLSTFEDAVQIDGIPLENAVSVSKDNAVTAKKVSVADFLANKCEAQYIEIDGKVQARVDFRNEPEAAPSETPETSDKTEDTTTKAEAEEEEENIFKLVNNTSLTYDEVWFETEAGENFTIKTYKNSALKDIPVPAKSGKLKGIASIQQGHIQIILTSEDDLAGLTEPYFESAYYLNFDMATDWVNQDAGSYVLKVISNTDWTVETESKWATVSPASGNGEGEVTIEYGAAAEAGNSAEFKFTFDGGTKVFKLEQRVIPVLTIAQFTEKEVNTTDYYRLEGTFDGYYTYNDSAKKGRFYLKDANGDRILVYQTYVARYDSETEFSTLGLRKGDGIVVEGVRAEYNSVDQMSYAYVISTTDNTPELPVSKISDVMALDLTAELDPVKVQGTVMAIAKKGYIIGDETGLIYVYINKQADLAVGNKVTIEATPTSHYGTPQLADILDLVVDSDSEETPAHGTPLDLTTLENMNAFSALADNGILTVQYVKVRGTLDSGYKVLQPEGSDYAVQLYNAIGSFTDYNGASVTIEGYYYNYFADTKTICLMPVSVVADPYLSAAVKNVDVQATATSAKFTVKSNMDWTVKTDADWIKTYTQSGKNIGAVEITFDEYTSTEADRTATFVVSAEGQEDVTVTLTQKKVVVMTGDAATDIINADNAGVADLAGGYKEWTYKSDNASYAGQSNGAVEFIQIRSDKNNSGIVSTTSGGKLRKVKLTFTSESVKKNTANRVVEVYASNTAYISPTELYNDDTKGTLITSFTYVSNDTLTYEFAVSDDYEFVGLRSKSGAIYIEDIQITWEK